LVSGKLLVVRQREPRSAQALKPAAAVCISSNVYCALALSGVRQEI